MNFPSVKTVGIVGAGVAGLAAAKTLLAEGFNCTVYDRAPELGGVWADGYINFGVQVQKELYEFPDFPLPPEAPQFTPGPVFQRYLRDYADQFGVTPHLRLATPVRSVEPRTDGEPGWSLITDDGRDDFDYVVIATGLYSETPYIPDYPGREAFRGEVMHISALKTNDALKGRKVAVIGYGKSATDIAGEAAKVANEAHLIFRDTHWPVPRKLAGVLPFKWGMLNRLTAALITPYMRPSPVVRWVDRLGGPLVWIFWRIVEALLRVQFKLDTKIAQGKTLLPTRPVEIDCFGESTMVPRPAFIPLIRDGRIRAHRTEIARYAEDGLELADGDRVQTDCVVFGTGWTSDFGFLPPAVVEALGPEEDGFYLYRHMLNPDLPNLAFLGRASTFLSVLTYNLQARWLTEMLAGRVALPNRAAMLDEIALMKRWKRSWMPSSPARSARILLHMAHYHDELLSDFGADPLRKRGVFAPFKELMAPYQSSDYRDIASGAWRETEGRPS